jgi:hypothetical protein
MKTHRERFHELVQDIAELEERNRRRCFRVAANDTARSRARGARRGLANRYSLSGLPPVDPGDP